MGSLRRSSELENLTIVVSLEDNNIMNIKLHKAAKEGNLTYLESFFNGLSTQDTTQQSTIFNIPTPTLHNSLIHTAASFNKPNILNYLLQKSPDSLYQANYSKDTAHHIAAREGHLEVVQAIICFEEEDLKRYGPTNSLVNNDLNTPLHEAIIHERVNVVDYYLENSRLREFLGFYVKNNEGKSPLYLAVEAGNTKNVEIMLRISKYEQNRNVFLEKITGGKPLIHAAIARKNLVLLKRLAGAFGELVNTKDEKQQNSLHCASSVGFLDGVKYLMEKFNMDVFEKNGSGFCPIHLASKNGHVKIIEHFLQLYPDAREFLDNSGKNFLHIAAENGKDNVIMSILKSPDSKLLLNERDVDGNTCLHLATGKWHPKVVSSLTWDKRVNPKLTNNEGLTALEVAETHMYKKMAPFRQRLTWMALMSAGVERAKVQDEATIKKLRATNYEPYSMDYCKDRVNTLLLVSALVATITFAAGFLMPGESNTANEDKGVKIILHNINMITFMICDLLAFCSSITVVVILMWAQLGDLNLMLNALRIAQMCLGFSLIMTTVAFVVGIHLLVLKLVWLAIVVLVLGSASIVILLALLVPLFLPYMSNYRILRYISHFPFYLLMMASESYA